MIKNIEIVKTKPAETELEKAILRVFNGISTKMNEIINAVNEIASWKQCTAELLAKHDVFGEKQPARFTPEMMSEIRQVMKIPVVTDEPAENGNFAKNAQDLYAEQRKWIGKVCKFWDYDDSQNMSYGVLTKIKPNLMFGGVYCCNGKYHYDNCLPVRPYDDIIYKGGNNE